MAPIMPFSFVEDGKMGWDGIRLELYTDRGGLLILMLRMEPGRVLRSGPCSCEEDKVLSVERSNNWGFFEVKKCLPSLPFGNEFVT